MAKHNTGEGRKEAVRPRKPGVLVWLVIAAFALLFLVGIVNLVAPRAVERVLVGVPTPTASPPPARPKAAIIDQTGFSFPTPEFLDQVEAYLEQAGYTVERYPPEEVTVGLLRSLPDKGYQLILFQTHATSEVVSPEEDRETNGYAPGPFLFTTELYKQQRYLALQLDDQVRASKLFYEDSPLLFAVGPKFVRRTMNGLFPDSVIIIGGCQSLAEPDLAEAFLERGASVVIGWDEMVNLSHNNQAMLRLLEALLVEGLPPEEAVEATMAEVGPDPGYESSLDLMQ
jgi:hypothetical protein